MGAVLTAAYDPGGPAVAGILEVQPVRAAARVVGAMPMAEYHLGCALVEEIPHLIYFHIPQRLLPLLGDAS